MNIESILKFFKKKEQITMSDLKVIQSDNGKFYLGRTYEINGVEYQYRESSDLSEDEANDCLADIQDGYPSAGIPF